MPLFIEKKKVIGFINMDTGEEIDMEEEKPYLILLTEEIEMETKSGRFVATRGRTSVFSYLESEVFNVDPVHSYVMSGNIPLGKEVSVYTFMRYCIEKNKVADISITVDDLDDYIHTSYEPDIDLNLLYNTEINRPVTK